MKTSKSKAVNLIGCVISISIETHYFEPAYTIKKKKRNKPGYDAIVNIIMTNNRQYDERLCQSKSADSRLFKTNTISPPSSCHLPFDLYEAKCKHQSQIPNMDEIGRKDCKG